MEKLYIVTRSDLSPGARCAQSCHAIRLFAEEHPDADREWYRGSNNLVVLEAENEGALMGLAAKARSEGIAASEFREPDFADAVTAVALGGAASRFLSSLPLALKPRTPIPRIAKREPSIWERLRGLLA
jgi:peptidyl-tRNA hydrolase